ncbi:hypothetical protein NLI96_g10677 [Meripilus lineatus]|uniref:Steroid 5-alpha reductase C-terminal domain-containing protein n=1 Tax=Meripilus lineatus TaxID=2056292 RepID=A0AAD5UTH5_9APHY|nr:hypothetical protein NLI96_g10677 [Physisporinus lineatus]
MPVFSRILPIITACYGLQGVGALIFVPQANEKFYDLFGAAGFLTTTCVSLYYPTLKARYWQGNAAAVFPALAPRQLLLTAAMCGWSIRLGSFLFQRAMKHGGDSRFDKVKHKPKEFSFYWFAQATWVLAVGLPVYLVNSIPAKSVQPMRSLDYLSFGLFAASWIFELVADYQKTAWRHAKDNKQHDEKFISSGLWSLSRHPNYVGEVGVWTGIWAFAVPALRSPFVPRYAWLLAGVSPLMTWFLLTRVSGVPPLEEILNGRNIRRPYLSFGPGDPRTGNPDNLTSDTRKRVAPQALIIAPDTHVIFYGPCTLMRENVTLTTFVRRAVRGATQSHNITGTWHSGSAPALHLK